MKIKIQSGIPIPSRYDLNSNDAVLRRAISELALNDSFPWPENHAPYRCARQVGIRITTRKVSGEGYRVWRVK